MLSSLPPSHLPLASADVRPLEAVIGQDGACNSAVPELRFGVYRPIVPLNCECPFDDSESAQASLVMLHMVFSRTVSKVCSPEILEHPILVGCRCVGQSKIKVEPSGL